MVHSYYNIPLKTRWYHQIYDATTAEDHDPDTGAKMLRCVKWEVEGCVLVKFHRRRNTLQIVCSWKGYHMLPSRKGEWYG